MSRCCVRFHIYDRAVQGNLRLWIWQRRRGGEGFQDVDLGEVQGITDTVQQEVTEDDVMEMNDSEPAPDKEDDVERKQ